MKKIDAITLEIVANMLLCVAEEMGATLIKTAYSTNIKERKDCSTAVFDGRGNLIAQAEHVPMHLGSMLGVCEATIKKFDETEIHEGDIFITNDPYSGGGTHLPDFAVLSPVFSDGRLVAFAANIAHHSDIGGSVPGSSPADATSIFQEGIRIPICHLANGGVINHDVMDFLTLNTRTPVERKGDLNAQIAANMVGTKRLAEVIKKFGTEDFIACTDAMLDYAQEMMRVGISSLKNGVYTFEDELDDAGANHPLPVPICCQIKIEDGMAYVSFDGTGDQVPGPINLTFQGLLTAVFYCFKSVVGENIFANNGISRVLKVTAPVGSIVNCQSPAPVSCRIDTAQRVVDAIMGALSKVAPDRVIAASNGACTSTIFSGTNDRTGKFFVYLETIGGGSGASCISDGASGVQVHMTNTSNLPIESLESEYPIMVERYCLRRDSGGAGEYRGGCGIERSFRMLGDKITCSLLQGERHRIAPWGLFGGHDGGLGAFYLDHEGREQKHLASKLSGIVLERDDVLTVCTPGAGGYGDPGKRDKKRIAMDITRGKVSEYAAEKDYKTEK